MKNKSPLSLEPWIIFPRNSKQIVISLSSYPVLTHFPPILKFYDWSSHLNIFKEYTSDIDSSIEHRSDLINYAQGLNTHRWPNFLSVTTPLYSQESSPVRDRMGTFRINLIDLIVWNSPIISSNDLVLFIYYLNVCSLLTQSKIKDIGTYLFLPS